MHIQEHLFLSHRLLGLFGHAHNVSTNASWSLSEPRRSLNFGSLYRMMLMIRACRFFIAYGCGLPISACV